MKIARVCKEEGEWSISKITVTPEGASRHNFMCILRGVPERAVVPGEYYRLMRGRQIVMSNTPAEMLDAEPFMKAAKGHVIITGLGLGIVPEIIAKKRSVLSITIVELSRDVIALTGPQIRSKKVRIVNGNAFDYVPDRDYDVAWHDIWDSISSDNLGAMRSIEKSFAARCKRQFFWCREECERERMRGF